MKARKKLLVGLFTFLVVFSTSWGVLMKPQQADAQWSVLWDNTPPIWDTVKQAIFPIITDTIKSLVTKFAYEDLLGWISGEKDKPAFITNFDEWIFQQADLGVSLFLEELLGDAFSVLCSGVDVNLALYWKTELEADFDLPECTLSQVQQEFGQPGREWYDLSLTYDTAQNDTSYLFTVYELALEKEQELKLQYVTEANSGGGFVLKDEDGNIVTPGELISGQVKAAGQSLFDVGTNSDSWFDFVTPLIDASVEGLIRRGVNATGISGR